MKFSHSAKVTSTRIYSKKCRILSYEMISIGFRRSYKKIFHKNVHFLKYQNAPEHFSMF